MKLPHGWSAIEDAEVARGLLDELVRELPRGHVLHGRELRAIARSETSDGVLFAPADADEPVFLVHLTWNRESDRALPWTVSYDGLAQFARDQVDP